MVVGTVLATQVIIVDSLSQSVMNSRAELLVDVVFWNLIAFHMYLWSAGQRLSAVEG